MFITGIFPATRFSEEDNGFTCEVDLPGIEKSDIQMTYENGQIIVRAVRKLGEKEEKISRAFYVDKCKDIKATTKNGVLYITGEYEKPKSMHITWGD